MVQRNNCADVPRARVAVRLRASLAARDSTLSRCWVVLSQGRAEKKHASWCHPCSLSMQIRWDIQKLTVQACFQKVPWQSQAHRVIKFQLQASLCGPVFSCLLLSSEHVFSDKKIIKVLLMPRTCVCLYTSAVLNNCQCKKYTCRHKGNNVYFVLEPNMSDQDLATSIPVSANTTFHCRSEIQKVTT